MWSVSVYRPCGPWSHCFHTGVNMSGGRHRPWSFPTQWSSPLLPTRYNSMHLDMTATWQMQKNLLREIRVVKKSKKVDGQTKEVVRSRRHPHRHRTRRVWRERQPTVLSYPDLLTSRRARAFTFDWEDTGAREWQVGPKMCFTILKRQSDSFKLETSQLFYISYVKVTSSSWLCVISYAPNRGLPAMCGLVRFTIWMLDVLGRTSQQGYPFIPSN